MKELELPKRKVKRVTLFVNSCLVFTLFPACNSSQQNALLGKQQATVGGHTIVVNDCYRTDKAQAEIVIDDKGATVFRFAPCKDSVIEIRNQQLTINGKSYGQIEAGASVTLDHHQLLVNRDEIADVRKP